MTIKFVREAQQELLDAILYYEDAESGLGRRFRVELERQSGICVIIRKSIASAEPLNVASI